MLSRGGECDLCRGEDNIMTSEYWEPSKRGEVLVGGVGDHEKASQSRERTSEVGDLCRGEDNSMTSESWETSWGEGFLGGVGDQEKAEES